MSAVCWVFAAAPQMLPLPPLPVPMIPPAK